jgi:NhaA family Na+:H+ antiporter
MKRAINFLIENSLFLIIGAVGGLLWANVNIESYEHLLHWGHFKNEWLGMLVPDPENPGDFKRFFPNGPFIKVFDLHYFVNDILMALFFAIAGKEVFEATLPGGPLSNPRNAATPLIATLGGMAGPALLYVGGAMYLGKMAILSNGWAVPTATDIAFSYMVARIVFGAGHPAIPFLLLIAIADDALGLIILALFYPQGPVEIVWMVLPVIAILISLFMKKQRIHSFWPYLLIPGVISWFGFAQSGLHPALGLLPIIPTLPHAAEDEGLFNWKELDKHDTLNEFEHWWKNPVELILGAFGLLNAGVVFNAVGDATWLVLAGLLIGKPLGIWICAMFAARILKFGLPEGMDGKDVWVLGCAAGIGFTVALFVAGVAFPAGDIQDAAKMGALASFMAAIVTVIFGAVMGIKKVHTPQKQAEEDSHH